MASLSLRTLPALLIWYFLPCTTGEEIPICGAENPNGNIIDLTEPVNPGPFHDLTEKEIIKLREFLENDKHIRASKFRKHSISSSYIYMADLYPPLKKHTLNYLNGKGPQPPREARVMMFRGDKYPPVVEEYKCGPLPNLRFCKLLHLPGRKNPVPFAYRPFDDTEIRATIDYILKPLNHS
ncbi:amine oxidase [copper-containing], partial [Biomphalaria pfeifferi]